MNKWLLIFLLVGCAHQTKSRHTPNSFCSFNSSDIQSKHLVVMANSKQAKLARCFNNYLRFETNKNQTIKVCNTLSVNKNGKVTYVKVFGPGVPKDLAMCLEQELWTMNFALLQLSQNVYVQYPLTFKSVIPGP